MNIRQRNLGLTLVELLVALVAGLTVTSGVLYLYVSTINAHTDTVRATRLEEELSAVMNVMVRDMQRAGFARIALERASQGLPFPDAGQGETQNPFAALAIGDVDGDATPDDFDCILYSYDEGGTTTVSATVLPEFRSGFRLKDGTVDKRQSSSDAEANLCDGGGSWEALTSDWAANIDGLTFTDIGPATISASSADVFVRLVQVELTGSSGTGDNFVERTLGETVRVRNDQVCDPGGC